MEAEVTDRFIRVSSLSTFFHGYPYMEISVIAIAEVKAGDSQALDIAADLQSLILYKQAV